MPQIITFSKAMVMHFYSMKMVKFCAACTSDHLFQKDHFCATFVHWFIAAIFPTLVFIEEWDGLKYLL